MSDLTRYRIDIPPSGFIRANRTNVSPYADGSGANVSWNDVMEQARQERMLVPDTTLQAIADAWNNPPGTPEQEAIDNIRDEFSYLGMLLDALEGTDK